MAHFAELNNSNEVLRVIVISNNDVNTNGGDYSTDAETFVASIVPHSSGGNQWKQTSYNGNARKQYAGIGFTYNASKNIFIAPKPYASWSLDSNNDWQAPVPYPTVTKVNSNTVYISWDEDNQKWLGETQTGDPLVLTNYQWDASNLQWNEV